MQPLLIGAGMGAPGILFGVACGAISVWLASNPGRWQAWCDMAWWPWFREAPRWYVRWTQPLFLYGPFVVGLVAAVAWFTQFRSEGAVGGPYLPMTTSRLIGQCVHVTPGQERVVVLLLGAVTMAVAAWAVMRSVERATRVSRVAIRLGQSPSLDEWKAENRKVGRICGIAAVVLACAGVVVGIAELLT